MRKILLTGADGFIGQRVIPHLLEKNYVVHAVTLDDGGVQDGNIVWHRADLMSSERVTTLMEDIRPSHLLHLAWYVTPGRFWEAEENLDWLRASLFLAQQFARNGGRRIVTAGTCAEYDWDQPGPLSEINSRMRPQTLYGAAKYALYLALEKFAENATFSFASGRIFFPFGPNEPAERLIPSVIQSLLRNEEAKMSHGNQIRDFLHVDEVAKAFAALVDSDVAGPVNIASGKGVRLKDVAGSIAEIMKRPDLLRIGALASRENEPPEIVADVSRLKEEIGFSSDSELIVPLHQTIEWWRENL